MTPERGDVIRVHWLDVQEDPVGSPETCVPASRVSLGLFWAHEQRGEVDCLVTTTTIDTDGPHQQGYCVYPYALIRRIEVIKRARRKRAKAAHHAPPDGGVD